MGLSALFRSPVSGLVFGMSFALIMGNSSRATTAKAGKYFLQLAVVLLGFKQQLAHILTVGQSSIAITIGTISVTMFIGWALGRLLSVDEKVTTLISSGTAICGGSAIAAIAPTIQATHAQTALALAVVFLLNAVGLLAFPLIGHALEMSEADFGLWAALAIHDTSSVVGAATMYGGAALIVATTVKLTRALWILPLSFVSAHMHRSESKAKVPWFLFGFLGAALVRSLLPEQESLCDMLGHGGERLMVGTLFLIGAGLTVDDIKTLGPRPLCMAVILWIIVSASSWALIHAGWLRISVF